MQKRFTAMAAVLVAGTCLAHSELPSPEWCADGRPIVVTSFQLLPSLQETPAPLRNEQCGTGGGSRECGQFDDDYSDAMKSAQQMCRLHARQRPVGDIGSMIFIADAPASFLHEDHHRLYSVSQGLSGTCVRCDAVSTKVPVGAR